MFGTGLVVVLCCNRLMDNEGVLAEIRAMCVGHLGEDLGARLAALAKPAFALGRASDDAPQTGRCHVGGPALLEPGTRWPETGGGRPLGLVAVLDTDELAPWLDDQLPTRLGVVNVFRFQPDEFQIVLADPARAIEVAAPEPAQVLDRQPLNATPIVTLPSLVGESYDPILKSFDFRALPDLDDGDGRGLRSHERFAEAWVDYCWEKFRCRPGDAQAFGWPYIDQWVGRRDDDYAHLLTLPDHLWDAEDHDGGFERVMVSPDDLRAGRFTGVGYEQDGLH
ncbi:DUF1963 domain-containing protein [Promicromonospora sp. AC04]|uniref:DUF1963 domain-containing protein n=1 Tax=Promicromonospora sp. AC04 TaxID=2135723 RepID=UPI001E3BA94B|nr:DUF1963 domain-containing protein [Promicromonospora sp. AC04]